MSSSAYLVADPSSSNAAYQRHIPSSPLSNRSNNGQPGSSTPGQPFRPPAHKHAHHLHSIPPREKSTRTLILDHMLWVHARTRTAQARAELGMADRTGGTHAPNYVHRERPENYEEDEDVFSEGEDISSLTARSGGPGHTHEEDEDERLDMQDLALARSLRQRAESVEKVITSMLNQPPKVPPVLPEELLEPPTSPQLHPQSPPRPNEHSLPNGVRLRLALGTVINDVFARRAPSPPSRHIPSSHGSGQLPPPSLPPVLEPLLAVSLPRNMPSPRKPIPSDYIRTLYNIGADPDSQNSPPALRCPRHLLMGCDICVEAKANARPSAEKKRSQSGRAGSTSGSSPGENAGFSGAGNVFGLGGGVTGWQEGSGIGSGLTRPGQGGTALRRPPHPSTRGDRDGPPPANTRLAELIVRFLRLSALVAIELGREATEERASVDGERSNPQPSVSPLLAPRMLGKPTSAGASSDLHANALRPTRAWYFLLAGLLTRSALEGYMTGMWRGTEPIEVLLCVGLGLPPKTSPAAQQQRKDKNAPGAAPGRADDPFAEFDPDDFPELEDAVKILFPSLRDVNPARGGMSPRPEGAEQEYEIEMQERLTRFYDVPHSTPDVATHMEDLAWQYPAEAVERAACRFCEAVSRWRGKPELETYRKATWITVNRDARSSMSIESLVHSNPTSPARPGSTQATTPSLAHLPPLPPYQPPNPQAARKPSVEDYFALPPAAALLLQNRKRRRSEAERPDEGARARMYQMFT
ncbi:hypothetical protein PsYK624_060680 [Phanerochaete sordida]|uniref:Uncharacterized protein n=1 Tax=Phanerochaete sordida TaxID=48140 RepID=A0A9P3G8V5_9APHY|nr:hypothetical protein PsYK624_060680 [Phanerochaete sordida]